MRATVVVLLVLAAIAWGWSGALAGQAPGVVEARGVTEPSHDIEVVSPQSGVIERVLVQEGDRVASGQPLMELDAGVQKAKLAVGEHRAKSTAALEAADADLKAKKVALERQKTLRIQNVASAADVDEAELAVKLAASRLAAAKDEQVMYALDAAVNRAILDRMTVRAPMAGIVLRRLQDVGEIAEVTKPVVRLVVLDVVHIMAYVPLDVATKLRPGMVAKAKFDEQPDALHECRLIMVDPVADAASMTTRIKLELANPEGKLPAGHRVTVYLDLGAAPASGGKQP